MQFILFLLSLFAIGCVLYGISAGVQVVQRGFNALASNGSGSSGNSTKEPQPPAATLTNKATDAATLPQRCINELRALFDLYQSGALTQQEFEKCKWHVLHSMTDEGAKHG